MVLSFVKKRFWAEIEQIERLFLKMFVCLCLVRIKIIKRGKLKISLQSKSNASAGRKKKPMKHKSSPYLSRTLSKQQRGVVLGTLSLPTYAVRLPAGAGGEEEMLTMSSSCRCARRLLINRCGASSIEADADASAASRWANSSFHCM